MAQANDTNTTIRLSMLFTDPLVRDAFERAERDGGATYAVAADLPPSLEGGETATPELAMA